MSQDLRELNETEYEAGEERLPEGMIDADPEEAPEEAPAGESEDYGEVVMSPEEEAEEIAEEVSGETDVMASKEYAEFAARIAARRKRSRRRTATRKAMILLAMIALFAVLITMCGREIIRLKAENYALQKQQTELQEERDRLQEELKNVGDKEYIKDQARKQLRLLDPGEIMFIFDDGKESKEGDSGE